MPDPNDLQVQDISAPVAPAEPVVDTNDDAQAAPSTDAAPVDDDNAYLEDLIAADDEDLEVGEPPADSTDGVGQPSSDDADAGSPDTNDTQETGEPTPPAPEPNASQDGQQPPASEPAPESDPQAQQQPQAAGQEDAPQTPEDFNAQYVEFFNNRVGELAETVYALDDETREALDSEPSKVLPQLAGRVHMQVLTTALNQVAKMMPTILSEYNSQTQANQKAEDAFYEEWPTLKEHAKDVETYARAYMQANPGVDQAIARKAIGTMVSVSKGLALPNAAPEPPAQQQPPAQPVGLIPPTPGSSGGASVPTTNVDDPPPKEWLENLIQTEE